jgi:hypothetical protein
MTASRDGVSPLRRSTCAAISQSTDFRDGRQRTQADVLPFGACRKPQRKRCPCGYRTRAAAYCARSKEGRKRKAHPAARARGFFEEISSFACRQHRNPAPAWPPGPITRLLCHRPARSQMPNRVGRIARPDIVAHPRLPRWLPTGRLIPGRLPLARLAPARLPPGRFTPGRLTPGRLMWTTGRRQPRQPTGPPQPKPRRQ